MSNEGLHDLYCAPCITVIRWQECSEHQMHYAWENKKCTEYVGQKTEKKETTETWIVQMGGNSEICVGEVWCEGRDYYLTGCA